MNMAQDPLVQALQQARRQARPARLEAAQLPADPAAAYALAQVQVPRPAAWKIGGANPWSQAVFNNPEVFFGPLAPEELQVEGEGLALDGLCQPLAEPELMLQLGDPEADTPDTRFQRMGLGFEIPASVLPEALKPRLLGQIADRAGAGALWISAITDFEADRIATGFSAEFQHNDAAPVTGGSDNIIGGPLGAAADFLSQARDQGLALAPGQWIATGGLVPAVPVQPGDRLRLRALGQELVLRLL